MSATSSGSDATKTVSDHTLRRGLGILELLGSSKGRDGLPVVRIAQLLNEDRSQISRSLKTLKALGFVDRDAETLAYRLSWKMYTLGMRAGVPALLDISARIMRPFATAIGEHTHVSVLQGTDILIVQAQSPQSVLQSFISVGQRLPALSCASGITLLSGMSIEDLEHFVEEAGPDGAAHLAGKSLTEHIRTVKKQGYLWISGEYGERALAGIASPVYDNDNNVFAVVSCVGPEYRLEGRRAEIGNHLRERGVAISRALRELA